MGGGAYIWRKEDGRERGDKEAMTTVVDADIRREMDMNERAGRVERDGVTAAGSFHGYSQRRDRRGPCYFGVTSRASFSLILSLFCRHE